MLKRLLGKIPGVWQALIVAVLLLGLSVWANVHQFLALHDAPLRDRITGLEHAQEVAAGLIADGQARERALIDAADVVTIRLRRARNDYDRGARKRPLPIECAPGPDRMDATNRALGAPDRKQQP